MFFSEKWQYICFLPLKFSHKNRKYLRFFTVEVFLTEMIIPLKFFPIEVFLRVMITPGWNPGKKFLGGFFRRALGGHPPRKFFAAPSARKSTPEIFPGFHPGNFSKPRFTPEIFPRFRGWPRKYFTLIYTNRISFFFEIAQNPCENNVF